MQGVRINIENAKQLLDTMRSDVKDFAEGKSLHFDLVLGFTFEPIALTSSELISELEKMSSALAKFSKDRVGALSFQLQIHSTEQEELQKFIEGKEKARDSLVKGPVLVRPDGSIK